MRIELQADKMSLANVQNSVLGPTGNLRAPAILSGDHFIVGFNAELYEQLLCE
ncbi:MAG: hypothetical protein HN617_00885 [Planctomycetaceae bacterium]|nr:hypothetical protein [Planctomycetaceae bacterium]